MTDEPFFIVLLIITIILSAFFSGMEIAFLSANRLRIEVDKSKSRVASKFITIFTTNPERYIATMLIGNNIALVVYGLIFAKIIDPYISQITNSGTVQLLLQTVISTIIILIFAEFIPKTLFRMNQSYMLRSFSLPGMLFYIIFYPISSVTLYLSNTLIKRVFKQDIDSSMKSMVFGRVDLDSLIDDDDSNRGHGDTDEMDQGVRIFKNALGFSKVKIRECMVPRTDLIAVDSTISMDELRQRFVDTGFSKILVFEESIDEIIGCIHSSELFNSPDSIKSITVPVKYVPETMEASKLLTIFMQQRKSIAVVVDEFGGTAGIVTIEDILEEIFGDIEDEHDNINLVDQRCIDGSYLFSGRAEIDFINEKYGLDLPEDESYETVAGLILHNYESIPEVDREIEIASSIFKIVESSETRIELISIKRKGD